MAACGVNVSAQAASPSMSLDLGGATATFEHAAVSGSFADTYVFFYPAGNTVDVLASLIATSFFYPSKYLQFSEISLNGSAFGSSVFNVGSTQTQIWSYQGGVNTGTTPNVLKIVGATVGGPASYAGTLEFSSAAVPEPEAWALMIGGAGMIGVTARLRRRKANAKKLASAAA
ncbi:MAG: FxDxF family PEP-CTERM protein [Sphingomonadaceae bacterium]